MVAAPAVEVGVGRRESELLFLMNTASPPGFKMGRLTCEPRRPRPGRWRPDDCGGSVVVGCGMPTAGGCVTMC